MNQTIIQERSGLNQFYAKVYAFVGIGIALSALVSALMLTTFQDLLVQLMFNARISSAALFFVMAIIGVVIKKDLSGIGRALIGALVGLILAMIVNVFLNSGLFDYIISIVMVLVFAGLIAWDNQKIRYVYEESNGQVATGWAISLALSLYLDFINLFLSFLRIFGSDD